MLSRRNRGQSIWCRHDVRMSKMLHQTYLNGGGKPRSDMNGESNIMQANHSTNPQHTRTYSPQANTC